VWVWVWVGGGWEVNRVLTSVVSAKRNMLVTLVMLTHHSQVGLP